MAPDGETSLRGYRVHGRVQGVGFRWWTQRQASELGLAGYVTNRRDGTVEVHARGTPAQLSALEERLRQGPPIGRVERVERVPGDPGAPAHGFTIERW